MLQDQPDEPEAAAAPAEPSELGRIVCVEGASVVAMIHAGATGGGAGNAASPARPQGPEFGGLVRIEAAHSSVYGIVTRLWYPDPDKPAAASSPRADIELIGEMARTEGHGRRAFRRGVSGHPALGDSVLPASPADIADIYARPEVPNLRVGTVHHGAGQPAYVLTNSLLGKHFAVLGTTGSGKTCGTAVLLRALLDASAHGHVVLLDPHNEYAGAFADRAEVVRADSLPLPYWLMNFEESVAAFVSRSGSGREAEIAVLKQALLTARQEFAAHHDVPGRVTVDTPVPYYLKDLRQMIDSRMGKLDKPEGAGPYQALLTRMDALLSDNRLSFMFPSRVVSDSLVQILGHLIRVPVAGKPITIIDLSGVPSDVVDVAVSMLCRTIFDFGVWSVEEHKVPVLLVCEEAHRYVPRDESASFGPTRDAISRIAKQGRKYGVGLCLVSQRPSELSETVLSQCNTMFAMRMSNHADQEFVARALPDDMAGLVSALPALHTQEAVAVGDGVPVPVRLRFHDLEARHRPSSGTAPFAEAWQEDAADVDFLAATVAQWRRQG